MNKYIKQENSEVINSDSLLKVIKINHLIDSLQIFIFANS